MSNNPVRPRPLCPSSSVCGSKQPSPLAKLANTKIGEDAILPGPLAELQITSCNLKPDLHIGSVSPDADALSCAVPSVLLLRVSTWTLPPLPQLSATHTSNFRPKHCSHLYWPPFHSLLLQLTL